MSEADLLNSKSENTAREILLRRIAELEKENVLLKERIAELECGVREARSLDKPLEKGKE